MGHRLVPFAVTAMALLACGCVDQSAPTPATPPPSQPPDHTANQPQNQPPVIEDLHAVIVTNKGAIRLTLFASKTRLTAANFVNLAQRGYYDGLTFHRVVGDFMIQGGCPQGTGRGNPGYRFADECWPDLRHDRPGKLSMANAGPGTNGSQFFITHRPTPNLDGKHTVFGEVRGPADQEVVNAIAIGDRIERVDIEGDTSALLDLMSERVAAWNSILDVKYPRRR